ncbi:hypothetical protein FNV43_RR01028 [Rhamnella rubrinervis]|uniref:Flowering time control protein FCA n=1 Tax=Rhamnella rubrinervis TaxID=2594499 RepID=A0A8K0HQP1_9ROSA|nr:hypothetical protein FNV43_RR01028 [Rhamnella rubrinervis]
MYGGDRYGSGINQDSQPYRHSRGPSRFSDAPVNQHHSRRSPSDYRVGVSHSLFDSPSRHSPPAAGGGFRPMGGGAGPPPLSGQKRGFPFSGRGGSPDLFDRGNFAKLFVGSVPRTATEEDIRPLFEEHGNVIEVALIKDKKTGQQGGCCFIKYGTSEEADRAIRALHNQHTLPGGMGPIQVRYADGERERLGAVEYKLFVGSLNKQATEKEVEEIFSPFGQVEDVYLMRDELKQSRGCGFVKYSQREMALAAINSLNGCYTMRGCDQPLTVRFADPKRPKPGDSRGGTAFGGPGFGPRFQAPGVRPPNFGEPMRDRIPPNAWHPMSPTNLGLSPNAPIHGFRGQLLPRSGGMPMPMNSGGQAVGHGGPADGTHPGLAVSTSTTQQKPLQSPQQLPPSLQSRPQSLASYSQSQASLASVQQLVQQQLPHSAGQTPLNQQLPSQQLHGLSGQLSVSQPQLQQGASSVTALQTPLSVNLQPHAVPTATNQKQVPAAPVQQQLLQPSQQSPSQLAQMLSQQTQSLQASFQSSQQAFSQLQQQLQLMQPPNQGLALQQSSQGTKQQQWAGMAPRAVASTPGTTVSADVPSSTSAAPAVPVTAVTPVKCNWTEHTSPDGYKYYYNGVTGESRWDKPEDLVSYEQQHQKPSVLQTPSESLPQLHSTQQVSQTQQLQLQAQFQTQLRNHQQTKQPSLSSPYQASGTIGHQNVQLQGAANSISNPSRFQQGPQAAQEWMWKNKPTGV